MGYSDLSYPLNKRVNMFIFAVEICFFSFDVCMVSKLSGASLKWNLKDLAILSTVLKHYSLLLGCSGLSVKDAETQMK